MQRRENIQEARSVAGKRLPVLSLTRQIAIQERPAKGSARGSRMRVWLPHCVYRSFPLFVGTVGLAGCLAGNPASLALGGVLMLYSGGVCYLRRG